MPTSSSYPRGSPQTLTVGNGPHTYMVRAVDQAGNVDPNPPSYSWTVNATAPTVNIQGAGTNQLTPVPNITIVFSEPITGFTESSLSLTRNGSANLLTGNESLTTSDGGMTWTLVVASLNTTRGTYTLTLNAVGSGIHDKYNNNLQNLPGKTYAAIATWTRTELDSIVGQSPQTNEWIVGENGLATQAYVNNWPAPGPESTFTTVLSGDFDGNGKTELAGFVGATGQWYVSVPNPNVAGTYLTSVWDVWSGNHPAALPSFQWSSLVVGDFNGDGRDDIAGRTNSGQWWVGVSLPNPNSMTGGKFVTHFANNNWAADNPGSVDWVNVLVGDYQGSGKAKIAGRWQEGGQWFINVPSYNAGTQTVTFTTQQWTTATSRWARRQPRWPGLGGRADGRLQRRRQDRHHRPDQGSRRALAQCVQWVVVQPPGDRPDDHVPDRARHQGLAGRHPGRRLQWRRQGRRDGLQRGQRPVGRGLPDDADREDVYRLRVDHLVQADAGGGGLGRRGGG